MTAVTQTTNRTAILDDSQRTRCGVWTHAMGYHWPVSSSNIGRQGEFRERRFFIEDRVR